MIIKLDGADGCGKSTIARALEDYFLQVGFRVRRVSEYKPSLKKNDPLAVIGRLLNKRYSALDDIDKEVLYGLISRSHNKILRETSDAETITTRCAVRCT